MVYFRLSWEKTICLNIRYHVGGDDNAEGYSKMGEITWEKHLLLRRTGYDGSAERSILPDPISHRWNLLSVLRLWVSACHWWLVDLIYTARAAISVCTDRFVTVGGLHGRWPLFNAIARMKWCLISSQNILQPHGYGNKLNDKKCKILRTEALLRFWSKSTQFLVPAEFGYCTPCLCFHVTVEMFDSWMNRSLESMNRLERFANRIAPSSSWVNNSSTI